MGKSYLGSNASTNITLGGKTKDEIFDDFICDLFTSKAFAGLELSTSRQNMLLTSERKDSSSRLNLSNILPLDQSLLISTAKKQNMQMLLNNLNSDDKGNPAGLLSIDEIRNAAMKMSGDL